MSDAAIEIRGLEKRFKKFHLGPLDLTVPRGAIYGLIGPNGAGKTTTIDLLLGMGRNDAGTMRVFGLDHRRDEVEMKRRVGYMGPDLSYASWGKVGRAVNFVRAFYPDWDDDYCRGLLEAFGLDWGDKIITLSTGQKTKLSLVIALSHRPDLLLLDEPTAGLDALSRRQLFQELLAAVGKGDHTVLISSHDLASVERFADHIGILHEGELLAEGAIADLMGRYRQVDFEAAQARKGLLDGIEGVRVLERGENRVRVLVDGRTDALERLEREGVRPIADTPLTLEDLFLALTHGGV